MTDLRVGNRVPIFVTHVEFENAGCQAFVHVGDLGSQADTVIERTDEFVNSGAAEVPATCSVGDLCLALFHEDNGWYRAQVLSVAGQSFTVFFIDYGNTETVKIDDLRSASEYVLAIPALSTKCHISDCIPLNEQSWTEEETKKISSMLHSQEFIAEVVSVNSSVQITTCTVKLFKTDEPNVPVFLRKSSSSSDLTVKLEELQVGQEYTVFISYVESSRKFWVQLKQKEGELNSLMSDIGACFAEDLPSSGDILNPTLHQICASCFSEDGSFYRAKVQSLNGDMCKVFFVDYGNSENKSASELFTLPQVLCELPMQAIECSYTSKSDIVTVEDTLHKLEADGTPCVVKVVSKFSSGYIVEIDVVEKLVNVNQSHTQSKMVRGKSDGKLWTSVPSVVLQVGGVYDVCLSHVEHPGRFFVQLIGNASKLDDVMQSIDEIAQNLEGLIIPNPGTLCIAKFSDDAWYRSEILSVDNGRLTLGAIDFGFIEHFSSKHLLRKIDPKFKELPAQSVMCTLDSARLNNSDWSSKEKDKFCALIDKTALVCRVTAKSGGIFQVDLFDTTNSQEKHINKELIPSPSTSVSQSVQSRPFQNARPQLKLPPPETKLGSQITLCITAVKSKLVFGQVTHTPVEKVAKLQTDLNDYFEKKSTEMLDNVDVGSVCCTQYSDGGWYRGIVTALEGSQVEVSFADFGDSSLKVKSDLKSLFPSFCELPQQCILVSFENLPPVAGNKLESVLVNKRIDVRLKSKGGKVINIITAAEDENIRIHYEVLL